LIPFKIQLGRCVCRFAGRLIWLRPRGSAPIGALALPVGLPVLADLSAAIFTAQ
jgi:hypothetical protein